jgi:hypothetical protein
MLMRTGGQWDQRLEELLVCLNERWGCLGLGLGLWSLVVFSGRTRYYYIPSTTATRSILICFVERMFPSFDASCCLEPPIYVTITIDTSIGDERKIRGCGFRLTTCSPYVEEHEVILVQDRLLCYVNVAVIYNRNSSNRLAYANLSSPTRTSSMDEPNQRLDG